MEEIGETLSLLLSTSTSTLKAAVDKTLTLLRSSTAKAIADPSTRESKKSKKLALEEKIESLISLSRMLSGHEEKIKHVVHDLYNEAIKIEDELVELEMPDIPPPVLIHFVDVMDKANQYFDFKESAKLACRDLEPITSRTEISRLVLLNQQLISYVGNIGEPQVTRFANAIFWELIHEQCGNKDTKPKKDPALLDLIHNLVFKTRVKGYVMDQDPIAQLKKMRKSKPAFYENYFLSQQLPVECTERSIQEARSKYSGLLGIMNAKYKEASNEMHKVTSTPTSAGNKEVFNEEHEFTSTPTFAKNEEEFSAIDMFPHKRKRDQES